MALRQEADLNVQSQVTIINGTARARADFVINGPVGSSVRVPSGFMAEDINGNTLTDTFGNPVSAFTLGTSGRAVVEVKAGNGGMTGNQTSVYPSVQIGNAVGRGGNARDGGVLGSISPTSVIVLRKIK